MRRWCAVSLAALLLAPLAQAQSPDAPHPSPGDNVLYAHHREGDDESVGWMNADGADPDSNDIAMGDSANAVTSRDWSLVLDPATVGEVVMDGDIEVRAHVGGGSAQGVVDVSTAILVDGEEVASGDAQQVVLEPADAEYPLLEWTLPVSLTLAPGSELRWTLHAEGVATAVFLGVHEDRGKSHIILPITSADVPSPPAATLYENLTGTEPAITVAFNGTQDRQYNWSGPAEPVALFLQGAVRNGSVQIAILDGANETLFDHSFEAGINVTESLHGAAGAWRIFVNSTQAHGDLSLLVAPPEPEPHDDGTDGDENGGDGNETDDGKDSPGIGVLALLAVAVALLRRR